MRSLQPGAHLSQSILQNPSPRCAVSEKNGVPTGRYRHPVPGRFAVPFSLSLSGQNPYHAHCRAAGPAGRVVEGEVRAAAVTSGRRRSLLVKVRQHRTFDPSVFSFSSGTGIAIQARCRYSSIWDAPSGWGWYRHDSSEYRLGDGTSLVEAALTPIYPTVSGMGQSTWRKLCRQALSILEKTPCGFATDIIEDRITLAAAIAFLHNPPPNADLSQIRDGNHPAQLRLAQEELIAHQLTVQGVRDSERRHKAPSIPPASSLAERF